MSTSFVLIKFADASNLMKMHFTLVIKINFEFVQFLQEPSPLL